MTHQSEMIAWVNVAWKPVLLLHQTVKQAESEIDCIGVSYFLIFVNDLINPALGSKQLISVCFQKWQFPWSVSNWDFQYLVIIGKKYLQNSAAHKFIDIQKLRFTVKEYICKIAPKLQLLRKILLYNWFKKQLCYYLWTSTDLIESFWFTSVLLLQYAETGGNAVPHARQWICWYVN